MKYNQVTDNVTQLQIAQGSNIVCISLEDELIFIDTGLNTIVANDFRKQMEQKYQKKASMLLITHAHIDHFLGMKAFSDCTIVAAEAAQQRFSRFVGLQFTDEIIENMSKIFPSIKTAVTVAKISKPHLWVKERKSFGPNEEILFEVKGGHSSCSSTIFYKSDKILMVGDLIQAKVCPYFGEPDTDMNKWIQALKEWNNQDIDYILPGHGGILNKDYAQSVLEFFEKIIKELRKFKKEGLSEEELLKQPVFSKGYWPENAIRKPAYNYSLLNLYRQLK